MNCTINGKHYSVSKQEVINSLSKIKPENRSLYYINVDGIKYPVKQALACCLGIPSIRIQSNHALGILEKAGFEIIEGGSN